MLHHRYLERIHRGELRCCIKDVGFPKATGQYKGWFSLTLGWVDGDGQLLLITQCHMTPQGTIGHSGKLDPKMLFEFDLGHFVASIKEDDRAQRGVPVVRCPFNP